MAYALQLSMKDYLATFGSTHKVLKTEKILKEKDIPFRLMPTPKTLAAFCDLCITFQEQEREAVENALQDANIKAVIYRKEGDDYKQITQIAKTDSTDKG